MKILLIEDDEILADRLVQSLTQRQYVVDAIADGQEGLEYAQGAVYDLIISDVGLPSLDGITLCSRLRKAGTSTPILLMTAKDVPDERIRGLDAGADDHLTKPLNLEEMHARVRALLRRGEVTPETVLQTGALLLDPVSCQVTYGDQLLKLTPKEYSLLELFMRSPSRVFSRSHIIEHLWNFDDPPLEDSVKAHIKGLRRKLKQAGAADWIDNVYGIGYRFTPQLTPDTLPDPASVSSSPTVTPVAATDEPSSPATVEVAFKASMANLWEKYQGLMSDRLDALIQAAEAIQARTQTPEVLATAATAAHKLAGVLGMFELDEGSDLARDLEMRLETGQVEDWASLPALVKQLVELVRLAPAETSATTAAAPRYALLISPDRTLAEGLMALGQATQHSWQQVSAIAEAEALIQQSPPDVVVIDIAAASLWTATLTFVQQLADRTPAIPTIALTTTDSLIDRVAIAQAGLQRLLMKPVTPEQVWAVATQVQQQHRNLTAQVLVVDDDPVIHQALRPLLEPWGLGLTALETPDRFWEVLEATQPDLLILDVEMPSFSGIELCQAVRTAPDWQNLPILFLTSHRDAETVQAVFRAGADDFIAKPIVGPELLTRILNRLERNRLLQTRSHQDAVTGLPNYLHSKQALTQLFETAQRDATLATLAVIRVGDLGAIADQHGPDAKHAILQSWGQCFQAMAHEVGTVGYWGDGEFVIGLNVTDKTPEDTLASLLQILRRQIITLPNGVRLQPVVEHGITTSPEQGQTLEALYRGAIAATNRGRISLV
ncbi:MAG: response regulator [Leptolyngbya sp. SIOISBB]|nr:response regulator [Leptolyngbya sp. SIOISBB]